MRGDFGMFVCLHRAGGAGGVSGRALSVHEMEIQSSSHLSSSTVSLVISRFCPSLAPVDTSSIRPFGETILHSMHSTWHGSISNKWKRYSDLGAGLGFGLIPLRLDGTDLLWPSFDAWSYNQHENSGWKCVNYKPISLDHSYLMAFTWCIGSWAAWRWSLVECCWFPRR